MSANADVIREFLISLGVRDDASAKFKSITRSAVIQAELISKAMEGAMRAFGNAMVNLAKELDAAFYASKRTGETVANLKAMAYAASQTGSSAQSMATSIESVGKFLRSNPGGLKWFEGLGVQVKDANGHIKGAGVLLVDLEKALTKRGMSGPTQLKIAEMLGVDENSWRSINNGEFQGNIDRYNEMLRKAGLNPEIAAENSKKFSNAWREVTAAFDILWLKIVENDNGKITALLHEFSEWLIAHSKEIAVGIGHIANEIASLLRQLGAWIAKNPDVEKGFQELKNGAAAFAEKIKYLNDSLKTLVGYFESINNWSKNSGLTQFLGRLMGFHDDELDLTQQQIQNGAKSDAIQAGRTDHSVFGMASRAWNWTKEKLGLGGGGEGSSAGNLTALINEEASKAGIDPRIMQGIRAGESAHTNRYDKKDDALESSWGPFQLNRANGLGVRFEKETGLDVRDPTTIPAQARWVARYIARGEPLRAWAGYHGPRDADPRWGDSGYHPTVAKSVLPSLGEAAAKVVPPNASIGSLGGFGSHQWPGAGPLGTSGASSTNNANDNSQTNHISQTNNIVVNGAGDPLSVGSHVGASTGAGMRVMADRLRNTAGSVQ